MAMSRSVFRSLPRSSVRPPTALISHHRHRSNKTHHAQLIEFEADQASSSQTDSPEVGPEVIKHGVSRLEDAIHSIMVRRSAPDWLPFLPGTSFWVPPRTALRSHQHAGSIIDIIGTLASSGVASNRRLPLDLFSEDENMAFTSAKGWPSSDFYIEGNRVNQDSIFLWFKHFSDLERGNCNLLVK